MEFDHYVYIDYSENLIRYIIIEKERIKEILPKISKLHHYKGLKHKKLYVSAMKKIFGRSEIRDLLLKWKITEMRFNLNIFIDVIEFVKRYDNCAIFISVDNNQYIAFLRLLNTISHQKHIFVIKESELKKDTPEYKLSLIIDTMLNIERNKSK